MSSAEQPPHTNQWESKPLGTAADANPKVLRMDGFSNPDEVHHFVDALLVLEGQKNLRIEENTVCMQAGEVVPVRAGQAHAVGVGSHETRVIFDQ